MPLSFVCTYLLFHSSLNAFQHYAAVTHLPHRAERDEALNDASPEQEKSCQEQRLCLDRQEKSPRRKQWIHLILEEEGRFSSGDVLVKGTEEVGRQREDGKGRCLLQG